MEKVVGQLVALNFRTKEFEIVSGGQFITGNLDPSLLKRNDLTIGRDYLFSLKDGVLVDAVRILGGYD